jgi:ferredoxin
MAHRLRVDWIKCDGYGLCGDYAPDLIDLDDWRYPIIRPEPVTGALEHEAQRAVDCCPMRALALEEVVDGAPPGDRWPARRRPIGPRLDPWGPAPGDGRPA